MIDQPIGGIVGPRRLRVSRKSGPVARRNGHYLSERTQRPKMVAEIVVAVATLDAAGASAHHDKQSRRGMG